MSLVTAARDRGLSLTLDDLGEESRSLEHTRWRRRSIGFGLDSSEGSTTLSLRVTASEADIVGMGLQWIPASPSRRNRTESQEVHRVLRIRVGNVRALQKSGGRVATFFSVLLWLISSAGVAALAAVLVPRFMQQSTAALTAAREPRAAVLSRAAVWDGVQPPREHQPWAALFDPQVLQSCVDSASVSIEALRMHLSPLSEEANCLRSNAVPGMPIAAAGLASAVASVLTSRPAVLDAEPAPAKGATRDLEHFDVHRALLLARLCGASYFSCDTGDAWEATERLETELAATGLELVREIRGDTDEHVYVARNASRAVVVFRGSCTLQNVLTDLDMVRPQMPGTTASTAAERLAEVTGMPTAGMTLHRGFVEAYLAIREELLETLEGLDAEQPSGKPPLHLHITGHSMGGAMAVLAALEVAHRQQMSELASYARPQTYTFAAPRVGDASFADLFTQTFPMPVDHWGLQAPSDAVPHLPFSAWGFRHPDGVAKLGERPNCSGSAIRRSNDEGDSVHLLRPKDGDVMNWAFCHDLSEYIAHLRALVDGAKQLEHTVP